MSNASELGDLWQRYADVAAKHEVSPQQVCLAWELSLSPALLPIPGASRPESITDSVAAVSLVLDDEDRELLG